MRQIPSSGRRLGASDIEHFIRNGFVRIDGAFPKALADRGRDILWRLTGCDPLDPATWTRPVVRLAFNRAAPFRAAANTPILHAAFDALVGPGRWAPQGGLGTFPIRFPSAEDPGDCGWHIDASFGVEDADFMQWRTNVRSRGRALLMLFLFSDVGEDDAPTRIRVGSHLDMARMLAPFGEEGATLAQLAVQDFGLSHPRDEVLATGAAGTVYLCHPFLVHAAQPHRGVGPRFMAQPPLLPAQPQDEGGDWPVDRAIRLALTQAA